MKLKVDASGLNRLIDRLDYICNATINELEEQVADLAMTLYARAQAIAEEKLHTTAAEYIDALSIQESHDANITSYTIKLHPSANRLEEGWESFDMKPGLLAGPNAQVGANGNQYNTVPFEHFLEKAPATKHAKSVKKAIEMYGLDEIIRNSGNKVLQGKVGATVHDRRFDSNVQGMAKYQKTVRGKTQSSFMTFRRVSENSPADSWLHPGFAGIRAFDSLKEEASTGLNDIIKKFLK